MTPSGWTVDAVDEGIDEGAETKDERRKKARRYFHDVLKAKGMRRQIPAYAKFLKQEMEKS